MSAHRELHGVWHGVCFTALVRLHCSHALDCRVGSGLTMHKHKHCSGSGLGDGLQDAVCGAPHISLPPEKNRFLALQLPELELPLA